MQMTVQLCFPIKIHNLPLQNLVKNWNHVASGLSTTSFLYTLAQLNAFFLGKNIHYCVPSHALETIKT